MKMIRAIIRPEKADTVAEALAANGLPSLTKAHVFGRGRTKGIRIGDVVYDEFPKILLLMVVEDEQVDQAVGIINTTARTGTMGDGKIFISPVEETYTISSGSKGL
ncbi:Nitrogen regulatory protein P-II [Acididesulfobacillus acetoxydans]|uniref:Nitrogen regulatory protein P-II n=1 Tax=Acididesulfobacillus acetoxydans TaxID=1561005 RepID=A0A8S0X694_9FIRM|nr:P-II family nitrogen regulator [Acididesulfobacillus acetoxydans]CAA7602340.1 Nitrogen regulatory protein P-II [Acididesulfobacillus acetoxydans]CEJ08425.1 Nitrogen regulatory protein P-II [Acididesulfobacillus acetoxydans]